MKYLIIIALIAVAGWFVYEPMGDWKERVAQQRASFNDTANALYQVGQSQGNTPAYANLASTLYLKSKDFIALLNQKPYGVGLTDFESELLENAEKTKQNMVDYGDKTTASLKSDHFTLPSPPTIRSSDLIILRGHVTGGADGVLIVECGPDPEPRAFVSNTANVGAGESQGMAQWAITIRDRELLQEFGPLTMVSNGTLRSASTAPKSRPLGKFAIFGYPADASRIHVIAAPTGTDYEGLPLYSATYSYGAPAASNPGITYPPGVETPEQRRAYWESVVEARKKKAASGSR